MLRLVSVSTLLMFLTSCSSNWSNTNVPGPLCGPDEQATSWAKSESAPMSSAVKWTKQWRTQGNKKYNFEEVVTSSAQFLLGKGFFEKSNEVRFTNGNKLLANFNLYIISLNPTVVAIVPHNFDPNSRSFEFPINSIYTSLFANRFGYGNELPMSKSITLVVPESNLIKKLSSLEFELPNYNQKLVFEKSKNRLKISRKQSF
jgi:hypothetical protein